MGKEDAMLVVDIARVVVEARVEGTARVERRVAEEVTGGETVHSLFSK